MTTSCRMVARLARWRPGRRSTCRGGWCLSLLLALALAPGVLAETLEPTPGDDTVGPPQLDGLPTAPAPRTAPEPTAGPAVADLDPSDRVVFVRDADLWMIGGDGRSLRRLTSTAEREIRPMAAPDGSAVAYELYDSQRSDYSIWTLEPDTGRTVALLPRSRHVAWSPDAGRLLFASQRGRSLDIWLANRDGKEILRITATETDHEYLPCWSPDGTHIAFVREILEGNQKRAVLVVRDALGQETELASLAGRNITSLSWAPSPRLLFGAKEVEAQGAERLYSIEFPAGVPRVLDDGLDAWFMGCWVDPGRLLFVMQRRDQSMLMLGGLGASPRQVPGTQVGDSEPTVLPGPARRAPMVYVQGRRSFYLPAPRRVGEGEATEVMVPAADLAAQLQLAYQQDADSVRMAGGETRLVVQLSNGETETGGVRDRLRPAPQLVADVPMLPLREVARILGMRAEWQPTESILRVSGSIQGPASVPRLGQPSEVK